MYELLSGGFQHVTRVGKAAFAVVCTTYKAGKFMYPAIFVQSDYIGLRPFPIRGFFHTEVGVAKGCDLRKVGHAQHLLAACDGSEDRCGDSGNVWR